MTILTIHFYEYDGGNLIDLPELVFAERVVFESDEHGFASLSLFVPMDYTRAMQFYDRPQVWDVKVYDRGGVAVWHGRVEDGSLTDKGLDLVCFGYWNALTDTLYTALWSKTRYTEIRQVTLDDVAGFVPQQYFMDNNNRVYIAPQKGENFTNLRAGGMTYETPDQGSRTITQVIFDYAFIAPVTWRARFISYSRDFTGATALWTLNATGALLTGTQTLTVSSKDRVSWVMQWNSAVVTMFAGETGDAYLKITNIRIKSTTASTVYADAIASDLVASVNGYNPTQISTSTALIQSPAVDLTDVIYRDRMPADIMIELCTETDSNNPEWEAGVFENRALYFRPLGSVGLTFLTDAVTLELNRSISKLGNVAYARYTDATGVQRRTADATNASSATLYGVKRRIFGEVDTTSSTQATDFRDALLDRRDAIEPRARFVVGGLMYGGGMEAPIWSIRSGDVLNVVNLPPTLGSVVDEVRIFRVSKTRCDVSQNSLEVTPDLPLPNVANFIAASLAGERRSL